MSLKGLKLQHLRCFVAVYEQRSFTAAARRLHATQSGVSMQIRTLEEILGLKLFERGATGVVPTSAGERVYAHAARILREIGSLEAEVAEWAGGPLGSVRAGIMPTFARSILAPVLTRFLEARPLVEVRVTEGYSGLLTRMVAEGELDFAIVPAGDLPVGLRAVLVDTDMELFVSRRDAWEAGVPVSLAAAPPQRLVLPGPENARRRHIEQYLETVGRARHMVMELDSMMATLDMIRGGGWASVLPGCLCLPDLEDEAM
ncbi:MAG: LysR family transcriptional regulator, partial [Alphaproteobacteria bacterium]